MQRTAQDMHMTCTARPLARLYRQLGGAEWGCHLYCAAGAVLTERFNPRTGFRRTTSLTDDHACCDHQYYEKVLNEMDSGQDELTQRQCFL